MTDEELIAKAAELYSPERWGKFDRGTIFGEEKPIAGTEWDQKVPAVYKNPYWEIIRLMPADWDQLFVSSAMRHMGLATNGHKPSPHGFWMGGEREDWDERTEAGLDRMSLARRFSWAIPSPRDLGWITEQLLGRGKTQVVEIGAGTGYWAWQMHSYGLSVAAYDIHTPGPGNAFATGGPYFRVRHGGPMAANLHDGAVLFMSWPNYNDPWAYEALKAYKGSYFIFAGEGPGGCTADDKFYELLGDEWVHKESSGGHHSFWGIHCELSLWERA